MASIRDFSIATEAVAVATITLQCANLSGDLLVAAVNKDTAANFTTPSGWTALQTQVSAGAGGGIYAKIATSDNESVAFAYTSETSCGCIIAIKDFYGSTVAEAIPSSAKTSADDSTLPLTGQGITPSYANSLIIHALSTDSGGGFNALPPWVNLAAIDAGANSLCVSYTQQVSTDAVAAPNHWGGLVDDSRGFVLQVRDSGTVASRDGYIPLSTTPCRQITPLNGSTGVVDKGAWAAAASNTITSVGGKAVTGTAIAATADSGINPYRGSARAAGATSKTNYSSVEMNMTATDDLTNLNGLVFTTYMNLTASDYKDQGTVAQGGKYLLLGSTSGNWRAWNIGGFNCKTEKADARNNVLIELANTATDLATTGTPDWSAFDIMQFGAMGYASACSVLMNELYLINIVTMAGGSASSPIDLDDLVYVVNNGCGILPLLEQSGVQITVWAPLKLGGVDPLHFSDSKKVMAFPPKADGMRYVSCHIYDNKLGIEFDGQDRGSGDVDTIHFPGWMFIAPSNNCYWRFASTHDAGADIDFTGATVVGPIVTLQSTVTLQPMAFVSCPTFTQNGAPLDNIEFTDTKVTSATLADMDNITNCSFTKTTGTNHAIEVGGSASTITFTGNTFTGYGTQWDGTGDQFWDSVVLAMHMDGTNGSTTFTDAKGHTVTPYVNAQISTAQSVFGGASAYFDGTGDYLLIANSSDFDLGAADFSIRFRIRFSTVPGSGQSCGLISKRETGALNYAFTLFYSGDSGLGFGYTTNGTTATATYFAWTPSANTFYDLSLERSDGVLRAFIGGTQIGSDYSIGTEVIYNSTQPLMIAAYNATPAGFLHGYMDELRITKGVARYVDDFTVPTSAYADSGGDAGNAAIYVNIASGTVTLNISGGDTPSIRTAGATVLVNNSITLQLTGLVSGSDIVILNAGTETERVNVDANVGTTYDYSFTTGGNVDICVYKQGYIPNTTRNYTLPASNGSLPIKQVADRNFSNP